MINGGPCNPFTRRQPLVTEPCIFVVAKEACRAIWHKVHRDMRPVIDMVGFVALCGKCAYNHGIETLPKAELEQLAAAGVVYDLIAKPVVDKIASTEMTRDG